MTLAVSSLAIIVLVALLLTLQAVVVVVLWIRLSSSRKRCEDMLEREHARVSSLMNRIAESERHIGKLEEFKQEATVRDAQRAGRNFRAR